MITKEKILKAKCKLYLFLLENNNDDDLTDNELEIMSLLSKDSQIQALLEEKTNETTPLTFDYYKKRWTTIKNIKDYI